MSGARIQCGHREASGVVTHSGVYKRLRLGGTGELAENLSKSSGLMVCSAGRWRFRLCYFEVIHSKAHLVGSRQQRLLSPIHVRGSRLTTKAKHKRRTNVSQALVLGCYFREQLLSEKAKIRHVSISGSIGYHAREIAL